jgi:iron complex outermembrane receptor protein
MDLFSIAALRWVLFLGIFALAIPASGQDRCTSSLSGKAVDEHNGEPLQYARIELLGEGRGLGAVTDTSGAYQIEGICPGTYSVMCTHLGCDTLRVSIKISGNTNYNFFPEHHEDLLETVDIVGRAPDEETSHSESTLSQKEMDEGKGQPLGEMLKSVPGLTTLNTGNSISKPVIHGLHSNRVLILNNGVRQEGQQWGNEHAPEIDPFVAGNLTVVKGAGSVRYGPDAIGGVILLNPRKLPANGRIGGELNLVGFSNGRQGVASAMLEGNFDKVPAWSWRAQGSLKGGGNVRAPNYYIANTGLREYNFSVATAWTGKKVGLEVFYSQFNTDLGIFSGAHIGNLTDLQVAFEAPEPLVSADFTYKIGRPRQHIEHELFKARAYWRTGLIGKLNLTYARQYNLRFEYDKDPPLNDSLAALNRPDLQFEITTHTVNLEWEHYRRHGFKGTAGISTLRQGNTYEGRFFIPNFRKFVTGVFVTENWKPDSSRIELEAGARFDYAYQQVFLRQGGNVISPDFQYQNISWNLGGIYSFSKKISLRANLGSAWRPPGVNELYSNGLHHGAAAVEIGDPTLDRENSISFSGLAEYESEKIYLAFGAYQHRFSNFIYLVPVLPPTLTIRGAFPTFFYKQIPAVLSGIDFTAKIALNSQLTLTSKASMLRALDRNTGEHLVQMPSDRFEHTIEYKRAFSKATKSVSFAVTVENVLKQWRVRPEIDFVTPPPGYTLLGCQAWLDVPMRGERLRMGLAVQNLLNTSYREYLNRFRYYADNIGRNVSFRLIVPFSIVAEK